MTESGPQASRDPVAVDVRQPDVNQDEIGTQGRRPCPRGTDVSPRRSRPNPFRGRRGKSPFWLSFLDGMWIAEQRPTTEARRSGLKLDTILVPVDGSALAESAIATAVDLARPGASTIILMRAAEAHTLPGVDPMDAQVQIVGEAEGYLAGVVERLTRQGVANVQTSVWYGPAAPAIVDAAQLWKADLVVMTTHGRSGVGRLILGSVAESVLRGTTVPILLLRAPKAPLEPPRGMGQARPAKGPSHG